MKFELSVTRPLHLFGILLPFDCIVECTRGNHRVSSEAIVPSPMLRRCIHVPESKQFDYLLVPDASGAAATRLNIMCETTDGNEMGEHDWNELAEAFRNKHASMTQALTRKVFLYPSELWTLKSTSHAVDATARALQTRLFRENASFAHILMKQRRLRALLSLLEFGTFHEGVSLRETPSPRDVKLARSLRRSYVVL
jgi:hypothetical protein